MFRAIPAARYFDHHPAPVRGRMYSKTNLTDMKTTMYNEAEISDYNSSSSSAYALYISRICFPIFSESSRTFTEKS